jgi:hypothetical protein
MQRGSVGMDFPDLANILGKSGDPAVFEPLIEGLREGSEYIRSVCALALGYFGDKRAIPLLVETYCYDKGLYVRCDVALALGTLQAVEELTTFVQVFFEELFEVQKRLILALKIANTDAAKEFLTDLASRISNAPMNEEKKEFLLFYIQSTLS